MQRAHPGIALPPYAGGRPHHEPGENILDDEQVELLQHPGDKSCMGSHQKNRFSGIVILQKSAYRSESKLLPFPVGDYALRRR